MQDAAVSHCVFALRYRFARLTYQIKSEWLPHQQCSSCIINDGENHVRHAHLT